MQKGKTWFYVVGWVIAVFCIGLLILNHSLTNELNDNIDLLNADLKKYKDLVNSLTEQNKDIESKLLNEMKIREELDKKIKNLESSNAEILQENAAYKKSLASLSDVAVVEEIGKKIGNENVSLSTAEVKKNLKYVFSLTRDGAEHTLSLFRDADDYFTLSSKRLEQINLLNSKVDSLERTDKLNVAKLNLTEQALFQANEVIKDYDLQLSMVKKKARSSVLKKVGVGVLFGVVAGLIVDK